MSNQTITPELHLSYNPDSGFWQVTRNGMPVCPETGLSLALDIYNQHRLQGGFWINGQMIYGDPAMPLVWDSVNGKFVDLVEFRKAGQID